MSLARVQKILHFCFLLERADRLTELFLNDSLRKESARRRLRFQQGREVLGRRTRYVILFVHTACLVLGLHTAVGGFELYSSQSGMRHDNAMNKQCEGDETLTMYS